MKEKPPTPKEVYDIMNRRYFRGRLPDIPVRFRRESFLGSRKHIMGSTWFDADTQRPKKIELNPMYKSAPILWLATLLHEAVHVEQWKVPAGQEHGRKFQKRMKQLVNRGAYNKLW
jgi:hypothetical protein